MNLKNLLLFAVFYPVFAYSQRVEPLTPGPDQSFRGMSVVSDKIIWVSGAKGTVGRSLDGGQTWTWIVVPGYEKCDFRDIEAFDGKEAVIMAVASPAYILKTIDGGKTWKTVYAYDKKEMFLDAMSFCDKDNGIVIGDPVGGRFFIAHTIDGGNTWHRSFPRCVADSGEAFFASSGTNVTYRPGGSFEIISGGVSSNYFEGRFVPLMCPYEIDSIQLLKKQLPVLQGKSSSGANSIAEHDLVRITVGGDFTLKDSIGGTCAISSDGGKTWTKPAAGPFGYRSCVEYLWKDTWICSGLNGIDISEDNGEHWRSISKDSFHVCQKAKKGKAVFFIGNKGQIGKLVW